MAYSLSWDFLVGIFTVLLISVETTSLSVCSGLNVGTNPHIFDIVKDGVLNPEYKKDKISSMGVTDQQTDYIYVKYTGNTKLDVTTYLPELFIPSASAVQRTIDDPIQG